MNRAGQRVQVFGLGLPKDGTPRDRRRYRAKWRIDGQDKTRSFKTKPEAEQLRARLLMAVLDGEAFDYATGFPWSWITSDATWWQWSQEWLALKWPRWAGHTRRSAVESLLAITPLMSRSGAPAPPGSLVPWLREHGYRPGSAEWDVAPEWLSRWSIPLTAVGAPLLESVLSTVCTKADGSAMSREVTRRRRTTLNAILRAAVRRRHIDTNPLDDAEWTLPSRNIAVDVSTVPSFSDVLAAVEHVASLKTEGARYAALFAAVGIAGMRPSEAIALVPADLDLPKRGWGMAVLRGATTSPGTRYTSSGQVVEDKELKQRPTDAVREVPLAPELVSRLRWHLERWPAVDSRVFSNGAGRPPTTTNYGPVWTRARRKLWPEGHRLANTTVYDLRHSAATMMLRAGVPPAEVARRLGHSVDVLMRVYAGVFDDERIRSNKLIERAIKTASRPR